MFKRLLNPLITESFFIFGPRGCGKTTFLREFFSTKNVKVINLLEGAAEERYARDPDTLSREVLSDPQFEWIIVDEIQKCPKLLDIVHNLIETPSVQTKFALTGSSARKLKRGAANLLAGRALVNNMFPLTYVEIGESFDLNSTLAFGTLPKIVTTTDNIAKSEFLKTYARTYLKEEVWAEHLIRDLDSFRKFLEVAAQANSEIINYTAIAKQVGTTLHNVKTYFEILEGTLVGNIVEAYHTSVRKRLIESPKFYFFDTGVKRALDHTISLGLLAGTYDFGKMFETFIINQMISLATYHRKDYRFGYLKTKDGAEIDLVIERPGMPIALIEIKSTSQVNIGELRNLQNFAQDIGNARGFVLSLDSARQRNEMIEMLPWKEGILEILDITNPKH
ncbi:MAG: hypothetical protein A2504_10610 [Bdellovibrionales bacterium RIFOXYD12_FULL_39_22]|nr:MAG: hypothetical protein A2385_14245 [Bdellovibrionales bacterium RIFOXYB1_FULL_39_21]OFZ40395.1 MAG: hypothetical protein A2485_02935 [Bdellovibrionales bacterium RIFOXYC12_FULL_39_17]OFZ49644.1 MAG: hypothetical protein A2404_09395 [Bdellovibrionales bacterium RIFOXYC1_FULL_39_130]OFZ74341.1 MAG: hypothetical protein A2451_03710 [Bdellovibrionales bacterium RIFOXYC2_FULL_39_8]OFZ77314.1 MAG: hypothetical protein A2560_06060 [Bdellovibrionales bacterium RIFOXYD1_FULL_39_84]OFZ95969.1 MAG: